MIYKDEIKRTLLHKFQEKIKNGVRIDFAIVDLYDEIEGNEEDKDNFFDDCMKYMEIDKIFEDGAEYSAINVAEQYLEDNSGRDINLVNEKLVTFYIDMQEWDKALILVNKLLEKEPDNKWNISKKFKILMQQGKTDRALGYINHEAKQYIIDDPVIFDMQYRLLKREKKNDIEQRVELIKNKLPGLNTYLDDERKKRFLINLESYYIDMRDCAIELSEQLGGNTKNPGLNVFLLEEISKCKAIIKEKKKELSEENKDKTIISPATDNIAEEDDSVIVKKINDMIFQNKNNPEIMEKIKDIKDERIRFLLRIQLEHATGAITGTKLINKVKRGQEVKKDDEKMQVMTGLLLNFLTEKNAREYCHYKWMKVQQKCIKVIMLEKKEESEKQK